VATSGDRLLQPSAEQALRELLPLVDLVTPNLPELAVLLREAPATTWAEAIAQGVRLSATTSVTVLVKGGHFTGDSCPDALVDTAGLLGETVVEFPSPRVVTRNTHGTGCSLSSAIATVQARTGDWVRSLEQVKGWLQGALLHADELEVGSGNGPIHHLHHLFADRPPIGQEFSRSLWNDIEHIRTAIFGLDFVQDLGDGSLHEQDFSYYLSQDALYLSAYSRVLVRASALAPTPAEQDFWANSAQVCLEEESELHRTWLGADAALGEMGPVTKGYVDHLLAVSAHGSYGVLLAAILPCYWLYAVVGERLYADYLARADAAPHPYAAWLETYADDAFALATQRAIAFTDSAANAASAAERKAMRAAFAGSSRCELAFFDAPRLHAGA